MFACRTVTDMYAGRAHLHLGDFPRAIEIFGGIVAAPDRPPGARPPGRARSSLRCSRAAISWRPWRRRGGSTRAADMPTRPSSSRRTTNHPDTASLGLPWRRSPPSRARRGRGGHRTHSSVRTRCVETHDMPVYRPRVSSELGVAWALGGRADRGRSDGTAGGGRGRGAPGRPRVTRKCSCSWPRSTFWRIASPREPRRRREPWLTSASRGSGDTWHTPCGSWATSPARQGPAGAVKAEEYYKEARGLADELGMRPLRARCALGLARLLGRDGSAGPAPGRRFRLACAGFRDLGMSADLAGLKRELAALT